MRYDKEQIITDFNLTSFGSQGWLTNKSINCPFCGKPGKWGIIFNINNNATFHCWKCPKKTSLFEFLKKLNRLDLTKHTYAVPPKKINICPKIGGEEQEKSKWMVSGEEVKEELKPVSLPLRLKPLINDEYLNSRGFKFEHYALFEPSYTMTPLEAKLNNFIIFKHKIDGVCVAWWARSRYTKEWHVKNMEAYKNGKEDLVLRYRNSENNFQDLLGGGDAIVPGKTKIVILVEGIFDMVNVSNLLNLNEQEEIKCCFTFGNSVGRGQINLLKEKGVETIILLYDNGTINESKEAALKMRDVFKNVYVTAIRKREVDPGNIGLEYLEEVMAEAIDPIMFFYNKIDTKI